MGNQKLNYDKNLNAAKVFLNMFHLEVLERIKVEVGDILPIVDDGLEEVGSIAFLDDTISINAMSDIGILKASYKPAIANLGIDSESYNCPRYGHWNTEIKYEVKKNNGEIFNGNCIISASIDDEFGMSVIGRHKFYYFVNGLLAMNLKMQLNGAVFDLTLFNKDEVETISIRHFSLSGSLMRHEIKKGKYVSNIGYPKQFYTSILGGETSPTMIAVRALEQMGEEKDFRREEFLKEDYNSERGRCGRGIILQLGSIMREYDPSCFERINDVRNILTFGNGSLLDSFINTSLSSYSDAEIEALFGFKRKPIKYQGRVRELKELYFGNRGN